jgi:pimeloyl-ACP methyl ester carboxylesterase
MASGRMEFHAESIMQHTNFSFVLPNDVAMEEVFDLKYYDRDPMNLILLHGLTGTDTDWLYGGVAQLMAIQYNLNIFMPTTGNSFYLDQGYKGRNYCEFIAEELPEYIQKTFGIKMERENTMIGGLSMGGYGSLHTALTYPEKFSACIALSSALVVRDVAKKPDSEVGSVLPLKFREDLFGDPSKLIESDMTRQVHPKLAACKAAIHDVVGIRIRLDNGGKHVLALIQMLRNTPLLETQDKNARYRFALFLVLDDVNTATMIFGNRSSHERTGNTPHVHVLD